MIHIRTLFVAVLFAQMALQGATSSSSSSSSSRTVGNSFTVVVNPLATQLIEIIKKCCLEETEENKQAVRKFLASHPTAINDWGCWDAHLICRPIYTCTRADFPIEILTILIACNADSGLPPIVNSSNLHQADYADKEIYADENYSMVHDFIRIVGSSIAQVRHTLEILLSKNKEKLINKQDSYGNTPLMVALEILRSVGRMNGFILVDFNVKIPTLLCHGADPNIANNAGETPLMLAAQAGDVKMVQLLLDHGAQLETINNAGQDVWEYATSDTEIVAVLDAHRQAQAHRTLPRVQALYNNTTLATAALPKSLIDLVLHYEGTLE